jgi:hypothetical protein
MPKAVTPRAPPKPKDPSGDARIMGKKGSAYTIEECQRILQEKNRSFKKSETKGLLFQKVEKCPREHKMKKTDRVDILNQPLHSQHIRWQVLDADGEFAGHAYPIGFSNKIEDAIESALAKDEARRMGQNAIECSRCKIKMGELNFPSSIGQCCGNASRYCRGCIEIHIRQRVEEVEETLEEGVTVVVKCLMCNEALKADDVKLLASARTWEK